MRTRLVSAAAVPIIALTGALAARPAPTRPQTAAGLFANWTDLETWTRDLESSQQKELGLGLQVSGSGGTLLIAFHGRLDTGAPSRPPFDVGVQVAAGERANPNALRSATLTFVVSDNAEHHRLFDLSPTLLVDNPAPGAGISNGVTHMPAKDYLVLASAATLHATILGFDVDFRPDQIRAMQTLAEKLHLTAS